MIDHSTFIFDEEMNSTNDILYGELYFQVQLKHVFHDSKTFNDSIPKISPRDILQIYQQRKSSPDFDLSKFVEEYFHIPCRSEKSLMIKPNESIVDHLNEMWNVLTRENRETVEGNSLISLPYPYIVPGGRFDELFYWDTYFTMLGLEYSTNGKKMIENLINNFSYLIDQYGFIPNGTRIYFLSRSQPPFFALMIQLLSQISSNEIEIRRKYLSQLEKEYEYWMDGIDQLNENEIFSKHVVRLSQDQFLNRYFDYLNKFRVESYPKEVQLCLKAKELLNIDEETFNMHNRSACESGWDFSSRWFKHGYGKESNSAAFIIPVDLNCLIYFMEKYLCQIYKEQNQIDLSIKFEKLSNQRKELIQELFWSRKHCFFVDYDRMNNCQRDVLSLAAVYPLYFRIATNQQAKYVCERLQNDFLHMGGLVTTLNQTDQQWDYPNGWAPLQWIAFQGLKNYGFDQLANEIRSRWVNLNNRVYQQTGKMIEKYNVVHYTEGGGGYYPSQDGFGWTNGVYLKFINTH